MLMSVWSKGRIRVRLETLLSIFVGACNYNKLDLKQGLVLKTKCFEGLHIYRYVSFIFFDITCITNSSIIYLFVLLFHNFCFCFFFVLFYCFCMFICLFGWVFFVGILEIYKFPYLDTYLLKFDNSSCTNKLPE